MELSGIVHRLAKTTWVVLYKTPPSPRYPTGQLTLLLEPGIGKVWSIHNRAIAELHAKENNGMAATWEEAFRLLTKEYGGLAQLEDTLMKRIVDAQERNSKIQVDAGKVPDQGIANNFNDNP